jgi:hypothetical protein
LAPYSALAAELNFCNDDAIGMRQFNAGKADFLRNAGALIETNATAFELIRSKAARCVNQG